MTSKFYLSEFEPFFHDLLDLTGLQTKQINLIRQEIGIISNMVILDPILLIVHLFRRFKHRTISNEKFRKQIKKAYNKDKFQINSIIK